MAAVNGDTVQDTTMDDVQVQNNTQQSGNQATMKVYGTNEPYSGLTVNIGGYEYTTVGGALEGNSLQLTPIVEEDLTNNVEQQTIGVGTLQTDGTGIQQANVNPVTRLFQAPSTPRYRRTDNDQLVPIGANLHEHADGTIMTEHSMGPNDNSVVVTVESVDAVEEINNQQNGGMNGDTTPPPDITPPPSDGGGMNQGGGNY